jgi:dipeptidyl aminopeptidase/acylaminoacyl peptidase
VYDPPHFLIDVDTGGGRVRGGRPAAEATMTMVKACAVVGFGVVVVAASVLLDAQGHSAGLKTRPTLASQPQPAAPSSAQAAASGRAGATGPAAAPASGIKADYERAYALRDRLQNAIVNVAEAPVWIGRTPKFWYRKSVKGGNAFVLVDGAAKTKGPAFDHERLAEALSSAAQAKYAGVTLPFSQFTFSDDLQAIEFTIGGGGRGAAAAGRGGAPGAPALPRWRCTLGDYRCARLPAAEAAGAGGRGRGGAAPAAPATGQAQPQTRLSPDGKSEAFIQNYNVYVRPVGATAAATSAPAPGAAPTAGGTAAEPPAATPLSWDGSEGDAYTFASISWSPDSKKIAAYRRRPGYRRVVTYVQSSPADQLQPKASTNDYQKPGDVVDLDQPALFNLDTKAAVLVDNTCFPNPYSNGRIEWRKDSRAFTFEYNQRGHQVYRVIEVDAATGKARVMIEETSAAFIDYRRAAAGLSDSGRMFRADVGDGRESVWMSERDGWSHLYLYDGAAGRVKQAITKGEWAVHYVDRVDEEKRQIWFTANGMDAGKDPYFLHAFRINFDGSGLTRFTTADAMHTVTWSPDREYYVDSYSRVDLPPVSELHRTSDGALVMELERADTTALAAAGWKPPEVFVAKGRDGVTDIWGVIIRPMHFDPKQKYPLIENIYAGPQGSFVPKTFGTQLGMQTLAELGFVVVQIDGMGTANRSKAFHDVAFRNLGDAGFADRILWHKAAAAKYAWYDISRVGIYGTSAGGQNAMGAVLFHPEFYKAAAAASGCHDNRMDKIWWNEQWMGWPLGPHYAASSNMENAGKLQGRLLLIYGEMDTNVDPSSTMQVVNRLIQANKDFEVVALPNANHTGGGAYGDHKRFDFFVRALRGIEPPAWSALTQPAAPPASAASSAPSVLDVDAMPWVASEDAFPGAVRR